MNVNNHRQRKWTKQKDIANCVKSNNKLQVMHGVPIPRILILRSNLQLVQVASKHTITSRNIPIIRWQND